MMKLKMTIGAAVVMTALLAVLAGCQKQEGPAETAGKKIDQTVEKAGEKIEEVKEKAGEKIEEAGKAMKDSTKSDDKK
jgi:outer membrane murein-binding lipoprotein Lpp